MKSWGVCLIVAGLMLLGLSFGSGLYAQEALKDDPTVREISPNAIQTMLDAADSMDANEYREKPLQHAMLRVYTMSDTTDKVAVGCIAGGGLLLLLSCWLGDDEKEQAE